MPAGGRMSIEATARVIRMKTIHAPEKFKIPRKGETDISDAELCLRWSNFALTMVQKWHKIGEYVNRWRTHGNYLVNRRREDGKD
jgi:hypothetical protein